MKVRTIILGACLLIPPLAYSQKVDMPEPSVFTSGETWEWRQVDIRTKMEERRLTRTVADVDGVLQFTFSGDSNQPIAKYLVHSGYEVSSEPWRSWPLEIGKKWTFKADWKRADGMTGTTKQDVEVLAYEEVTVPAGKFMAYKIEHRGFYNNSRGYNGRQNDTFWYSPEARADVRHDRDDGYNLYTRELLSYPKKSP